MQLLALLSLLATLQAVRSHGEHEHDNGKPETNEQYAARHMASEHHIDSFDLRAFFQLHDLNRDGAWDRDEIEAVYGVHHVYSQQLSADDKTHQEKADTIVHAVLAKLDRNRDGKITPDELEAAGLNALPNFKDMGAEGHHYDIESEFFLHHEELYHSTPETQTDEAYNHPEDLEHFAMHERIEAEEEARERKFQGLAPDEPLNPAPPDHDHDHQASSPPAAAEGTTGQPAESGSAFPEHVPPAHPHDDQKVFDPSRSARPSFSRETPPEKLPPELKFGKSVEEGRHKEEWGQGEEGYKPPKTAASKMRRNLPYKYKFRRNWGDF